MKWSLIVSSRGCFSTPDLKNVAFSEAQRNTKWLKGDRLQNPAAFKLDKHFSFRLVVRSCYLLLMRWEWMDLVKLREREGGGRRSEAFTTVWVRRRLGARRRGAERSGLDAETELPPLDPLKQPRWKRTSVWKEKVRPVILVLIHLRLGWSDSRKQLKWSSSAEIKSTKSSYCFWCFQFFSVPVDAILINSRVL